MELFKHTYYINLAQRTDRRDFLDNHLKYLGISAQRIDAVHHPCGAIGCFESHIRCLEFALELNYPHICILEDDIECVQPELFFKQLDRFHQSARHWDVLMLGANVQRSVMESDYCHRILNAQTTCAYIVKRHYYSTLLEHLRIGLAKLKAHPNLHMVLAIDICWKILQPRGLWYIITPLSFIQRPGFSDIEQKDVDYTRVLLKKL